MFKEKKLVVLVSLFGISLSSFTYAGSANSYKSLSLDIPALRPGFEFDVSALWFKPAASNLNYVIYNEFQPTPSPRWTEHELRPNYAPGFEVGMRYVFQNHPGNDVRLNWTHFYSKTSGTTNAPNSDFFLGPDYLIGPPGSTIRNAHGAVQFRYDVVNFDFGQYINFGQSLQLRFFGGLTNPYLREEIKTTFSGAGSFGNFSMLQDVNVKFMGVGPRIGLDGTYNIGCGFGVIGEGAISVIIGSLNTKTDFIGNSDTGSHDNHQFLKDQTTIQTIPGLDGKIGVNYKYLLRNNMLLTATLGYQAAVYINAISQYLPGSLLPILGVPSDFSSGGLFVNTVDHTLSNYSVQGPYFNIALSL